MYGKCTIIPTKIQRYYSSTLHQVAKSSAIIPLKVPSQDNKTKTIQHCNNNTTTMMTTQQRNKTTKQQRDEKTKKHNAKLLDEK